MVYGTPEFDDTLKRIISGPQSGDKKGYRHSCYDECCEHAEVMSWHIYGEKPEELLSRSRPREDPEVTKYRLDNYEPTTKSAADKAINIVSKIFNPNLYSIRWKDENGSAKQLKEYTMENYPEYNSVVNYTKDVLLRKMIADPNGVIGVKPKNYLEYTTVDQNGETVTVARDSQQLEPVLVTYGSSCIWNFDLDHFLIHTQTLEEYDAQKNKITWFYFDYYDASMVLEFRCYITPSNVLTVEDLRQYVHGFGQIPAWRLQGKSESEDNGTIVYKSFFDSAVPYWNLSIIHESDVLGAFITHMHPIRVEISEVCDYKFEGRYKCRFGVITKENGESLSCPSCSGSGYKAMGPYGVFKISKEKLQEGDTPVSQPAVSYVTVQVEPTKMLEERANKMRQMGMWAINMDVEDEVGENQSGVAKVIDRSAQYDTLYNIGTVVFDVHLQNIFYFFNAYMFKVVDLSMNKNPDNNLPEINKPSQFDIGSTSEMINNFSVAKTAGLDNNLLQLKQMEILSVDFSTNPDLKNFAYLILKLDPLPGMSVGDVTLNVSRSIVRQVDAVIHNNLKRFIERAIAEDKNFIQLPQRDQIAKLEEYGNEFVQQNKPVIDPNTIQQYGQVRQKNAPAPAA